MGYRLTEAAAVNAIASGSQQSTKSAISHRIARSPHRRRIGIDLGFVALELSQLSIGDKLRKQVAKFAKPAIAGTVASSVGMNAFTLDT